MTGLDLNFRIKQEEVTQRARYNPHQHTQICLYACFLGLRFVRELFWCGTDVHEAGILKLTGEARINTFEKVSYISVKSDVVPSVNGVHP